MLAIGRAVLDRPRLLMLDEPTEGVCVGVIEEIAGRLKATISDREW
jgi:branched-chain amino acid transport system ATP-binding protein